jgi:hypothetical protein
MEKAGNQRSELIPIVRSEALIQIPHTTRTLLQRKVTGWWLDWVVLDQFLHWLFACDTWLISEYTLLKDPR